MKNSDVRDRRLVGFLWDCGDPACDCRQPLIVERWLQLHHLPNGVEEWDDREERVWEGTWFAEPASWDFEEMRDELTDACERHNMERDSWDSDRWEREL